MHEDIHDEVVERLKKAYSQVRIGDPLEGKAKHQKQGECYCAKLDCKRVTLAHTAFLFLCVQFFTWHM